MAIEVKTKRWGNSIGIIIPSAAIEKFNIKPNENILVEINKKRNVLKEMFGKARFNKSTEEILKESRREFESKWMK
jgi:antitoxin component of MazEF toxin-antitoxin module